MSEVLYWIVMIVAGLILLLAAAVGIMSAIGMLPSIWSSTPSSEKKTRTSASGRSGSLWPLLFLVLFIGGLLLLYFWPLSS